MWSNMHEEPTEKQHKQRSKAQNRQAQTKEMAET